MVSQNTTVDFLIEQMEKPEPHCYLTLFYEYIDVIDMVIVGAILTIGYVLGIATKYATNILTQYILISNLFKSGSGYSDYLNKMTERTPLHKVMEVLVKMASYKFGAFTLAVLLGFLASKAAGIFFTIFLFTFYFSFATTFAESFQNQAIGHIALIFALGLPVAALYLLYTYIDSVFNAFITASVSTYLCWWFIDKNLNLINSSDAGIESLTRALSSFDFINLKFVVFMVFVAISMTFQIMLYEPTIKVYYIIKTMGKAKATAMKTRLAENKSQAEDPGVKSVKCTIDFKEYE